MEPFLVQQSLSRCADPSGRVTVSVVLNGVSCLAARTIRLPPEKRSAEQYDRGAIRCLGSNPSIKHDASQDKDEAPSNRSQFLQACRYDCQYGVTINGDRVLDMSGDFLPALRFRALTRFYDPVVQLTTREKTVKDALIETARLPHDATVIDIGCGTGTLAIRVKQRNPGARVIGIDADPNILARARRKAARTGTSIEFVEANATQLPFADDFADCIMSSLFFHHLQHNDKRRALAEILRVLAPSGQLHIADWGRPDNALMHALFFAVRAFDGFPSTRDNVHGLLPTLVREAGAEDVRVSTTFSTLLGTLALVQGQKRSAS
jgi:ubiquinone/menaquinone biosynthesis C-methylase UbiE